MAVAVLLAVAVPSTAATVPSTAAELDPGAAQQLGLARASSFTLQTANAGGVAGAAFNFEVPIAGRAEMIELEPASVRASQFLVQAQVADGSYQPVTMAAPKTYRGTVTGLPGSVVGATVDSAGVHMRIILADDSEYWVEPIDAGIAADGADHIVYSTQDVLPTGDTCIEKAVADAALPMTAPESTGSVAGDAPFWVAELAVDADFDYFVQFGDAALVAENIESIINLINTQYERDVQIRHVITRIIVRTSEPNVYSKTCIGGERSGLPCSGNDECPGGECPASVNANDLLDTFARHWDEAHSDVPRDVAQLFTGQDMEGTTIGIAWRGSVSNPATPTVCGMEAYRNYGYSVVETNCTSCSLLSRRTDLSAHELGHNWGADHCPVTGWTMYAIIQGANRFHETYTIPEIIAFRDTRDCLDPGDELVRLIVGSSASSLDEQSTLQLTAEADFLVGPNQIVTSDAVWTVDPPGAGTVDASGVFVPAAINATKCVTVRATYSSQGTEKAAQTSFTVYDQDHPLTVVAADPPKGAIDAREPSAQDGSHLAGWSEVTIALNGEICPPSVFDFDVTSVGGTTPPPQVYAVEQLAPSTFKLTLTGRIEPGTWTDVTHIESGATTRLGYLPADVNGDGVTTATDILSLIDALNHVGPDRPLWSTDIDRSGQTNPTDILAVIDLLNGAGAFRAWNSVALP